MQSEFAAFSQKHQNSVFWKLLTITGTIVFALSDHYEIIIQAFLCCSVYVPAYT